jgi:hypothetical protein
MQPIRSAGAVANTLATREQAPMSAEQLRQLQTREFAVPKDIAFAATMTVLLDLGYRIQSGDIETGLIVASASSVDRLQRDLRGIGTARETPMASVYLEARQPNVARVRVNLTLGTSSSGLVGGAGERSVREESPYRTIFDHLEREMGDRLRAFAVVQPSSSRVTPPATVRAESNEVGVSAGPPEVLARPPNLTNPSAPPIPEVETSTGPDSGGEESEISAPQ